MLRITIMVTAICFKVISKKIHMVDITNKLNYYLHSCYLVHFASLITGMKQMSESIYRVLFPILLASVR
jgi:hypothetical protein